MSSFAKIAVGLAFALPLTAYVVATLAGADPAPAEHAPIILEKSPGPAGQTPSPRPSSSSGPRDDDPEVVAPRPVESDDDDWDDDPDDQDDRDDRDERGRGGERDDDQNDD
ncbi:hypothetical protein [Nocardioides jishulii]|uniref:Small secreted hydrophilic protein n=1 Tax=Nocardioides jishulii TaxID=2575440 RepID=A0A4U2YRX8_9ACTN|nr:hypothetical protein [Nocardioides jishulii]QCX27935.1 hypothetical protein FCL41_10680 [Nocardioides jishulii]TKI62741.1 hypothetical protein FC770_10345 [Nocardioides jishulii]